MKKSKVYKCSILSFKREKKMAVGLLMYVHQVSLEGSTRHQCCWLPVREGVGAGAEALGDFTPSPVSLLK